MRGKEGMTLVCDAPAACSRGEVVITLPCSTPESTFCRAHIMPAQSSPVQRRPLVCITTHIPTECTSALVVGWDDAART